MFAIAWPMLAMDDSKVFMVVYASPGLSALFSGCRRVHGLSCELVSEFWFYVHQFSVSFSHIFSAIVIFLISDIAS